MVKGQEPQWFHSRWAMVLGRGMAQRVTSRADEPMWVTDAFLVDPASAGGQGAVDACVKMGTQDILLGSLSAESPWAELQTPVMLDDEVLLYVMPHGGEYAADADADADEAVVVQFEGFVLSQQSPESESESGGEEARIGEKYVDEKNDEVCETSGGA